MLLMATAMPLALFGAIGMFNVVGKLFEKLMDKMEEKEKRISNSIES